MPSREKIVPGLVVEIEVLEGEYKGKYRTHVDEVGETRMSIYVPIENGAPIPLHEGTKIVLSFVDGSAAYVMDTSIIQRIAEPIALFVVELDDSLKRIQRRNYVRVPAAYPVEYRVIKDNQVGDIKKGRMIDLSGGGVRFQTSEDLKVDDVLDIHMKLPKIEIQTPVNVRRVEKIENTKFFAVSASFFQIKEKERDRIIHQVFEIQRDLRKKGLI